MIEKEINKLMLKLAAEHEKKEEAEENIRQLRTTINALQQVQQLQIKDKADANGAIFMRDDGQSQPSG